MYLLQVVETNVDYTESGIYRFRVQDLILSQVLQPLLDTWRLLVFITATAGDKYNNSVMQEHCITAARDWFGEQTLTLTGAGSTITWGSIVDRPGTSSYAEARNSRFDEIHVVVIDGAW